MLPTIFWLLGQTSIKLSFLKSSGNEDSENVYFFYLRLFTFTLESIQSKIVATMRKAKISQEN